MASQINHPILNPADYDAFKKVCADGSDLDWPDTHEEWVKKSQERIAKERARGDIVKEVAVNFDEFTRYAASIGQPPNSVSLGACITAKAWRERI